MKNKIKFALCYERWRIANQSQLGKNPFNYKVENRPDNFEIIQCHEYEQKPIEIDNDVEFRDNVPDAKKPLTTKITKVDATDGNKENITPSLPPPVTYAYAPMICSIPEFDQKCSLPKVTKKKKKKKKSWLPESKRKNC